MRTYTGHTNNERTCMSTPPSPPPPQPPHNHSAHAHALAPCSGYTKARTLACTDGRTHARTHEQMNERTNARTHARGFNTVKLYGVRSMYVCMYMCVYTRACLLSRSLWLAGWLTGVYIVQMRMHARQTLRGEIVFFPMLAFR